MRVLIAGLTVCLCPVAFGAVQAPAEKSSVSREYALRSEDSARCKSYVGCLVSCCLFWMVLDWEGTSVMHPQPHIPEASPNTTRGWDLRPSDATMERTTQRITQLLATKKH